MWAYLLYLLTALESYSFSFVETVTTVLPKMWIKETLSLYEFLFQVSSPNWMGCLGHIKTCPKLPIPRHSGPVLWSLQGQPRMEWITIVLTMRWLVCGLLFEEPPSLGTSISGALVVVGLRPFWPKLPPQELFEQELWDNSRLRNSFKWGSPTQSKSKKSPNLERGAQISIQ